MVTIGLGIIVVAWFLQYLSMGSGKKTTTSFNHLFLILYGLGSVILAYDSYQTGMLITSFLNVASFAIALAILLKVHK